MGRDRGAQIGYGMRKSAGFGHLRVTTREKGEAGMSEHEQGSMGIREHEKTFEGFVKFVTRAVIAIAIFLILLAIFNS